jgi:hypothetical protein
MQAHRLHHHHIQTRPGTCLTSYVSGKTGYYLKQLQQGHSPDPVCMELCLCPLLVRCFSIEEHFVFIALQIIFMACLTSLQGVHGGAIGGGTVLQAKRLQVQFPTGSMGFFIDLILLATLWLWGQLRLK